MPKKSQDHNLKPNTEYMVVPILVAFPKPRGAQPVDQVVNKALGHLRKLLASNDIADFTITENKVDEVTTSFQPTQGELFW